jgi:hypothetical protein
MGSERHHNQGLSNAMVATFREESPQKKLLEHGTGEPPFIV